jgi:hypothetical protein
MKFKTKNMYVCITLKKESFKFLFLFERFFQLLLLIIL